MQNQRWYLPKVDSHVGDDFNTFIGNGGKHSERSLGQDLPGKKLASFSDLDQTEHQNACLVRGFLLFQSDHVPVLHYSARVMKGVVNVCRKATLKYTNFCNTSAIAQAVALAHPTRYCTVSPMWARVWVLNDCFKLSWFIMACTTHLDTHICKSYISWSGLKLKQKQTNITANSNVHVHPMVMWRFLLQIAGYFIVFLVPSIRDNKDEITPWKLTEFESIGKRMNKNHRRIVLGDTPQHTNNLQFRLLVGGFNPFEKY